MKISRFDIAEYLDSPEMISEYLNTVLEEGNEADFMVALGHVAKAVGMHRISEATGMSRTSLYKALRPGARPRFETVMKILKALGETIRVSPASGPDRKLI